jgi:hypothetical protein
MRNSAGPDDAPDAAPDQHARPRHVAPLRTANDRTARLGLERPPATAAFHIRPLAAAVGPAVVRAFTTGHVASFHRDPSMCYIENCRDYVPDTR